MGLFFKAMCFICLLGRVHKESNPIKQRRIFPFKTHYQVIELLSHHRHLLRLLLFLHFLTLCPQICNGFDIDEGTRNIPY